MKFKTTIEIVSEASDRNEALEIVGDYLSGNIASGVEMRCATKPMRIYQNSLVVVSVIFAFILTGTLLLSNINKPQNIIGTISATSAIQAPLKTSSVDKRNSEFRKNWDSKQNKEALEYIKK